MTLDSSERSISRCAHPLIIAALAAGLAQSAVASPVNTIDPRVRSSSPQIVAAIQEAAERSTTFHRLIETVDASNGIVFVEQGECGHGVRSCLLHSVVVAANNRILRIIVDTRQSKWDLMGSIGHELYHAVEVLSNPSLATSEAVFFFYMRSGSMSPTALETSAAIQAGNAVRREVEHDRHRDAS